MKCPQCKSAMEEGYVTLKNGTTWYPGEKAVGFVKGQVWLTKKWGALLGAQAKGYICRECKWISFQYPG